jgi:hypothetical protein
MNASGLAKHYSGLTPEERFRLILAASGRGDEAERDRLIRAGGRITLSFRDHAPYAHAFDDLARLLFLSLLDDGAGYLEAFHWATVDVRDRAGCDEEGTEAPGGEHSDGAEADAEAGPAADDVSEWTAGEPAREMFLVLGFLLRTKADGWKVFCERMNVPPFVLWKHLPGFDRLQHALALAEEAAFVPIGFLRWLNRKRPAGAPEMTKVPFTVERVADEIAEMYRAGVERWGG